MNRIKIESSNIVYLTICVIGILAFCLVGIWPNAIAINDAEEEINLLNKKVKTQELLFPVYRELIREATRKTPSKLPIPKQEKIPRNDLSRINTIFYQLAQEHQVVFNNAVPDASSYLEDAGHLTMNVNFSGDFFKLRGMLLAICQLPYLESVQDMKIATAEKNKQMSFKLKFVQAQ